jgi:hypothetical protein
MRGTPSSPLSRDERALLAGLADVIAPQWNHLPSASDIDLTGEPLDRALHARPDLIEPLRVLLREIEASRPADAVDHLQRVRPAQFHVLMQVVAGAYYMNEKVREALRYPGQRSLRGGAKAI